MRPNSVFVYGTLMSTQVVEILLGRIPKTPKQICRLWGYSRHPVKDQVFPAIIPLKKQQLSPTSSHVDGRVWLDLNDEEMKILDWFEEEYTRNSVQVKLIGSDKDKPANTVTTDVYVWANSESDLELGKDWSYEKFCNQHLDWYLRHTVRPCREELDHLIFMNEL